MTAIPNTPSPATALRWQSSPPPLLVSIRQLLQRYGIEIVEVAEASNIPGSFWGDDEAGLIANQLHVRGDTPIHSILHESCHYICMDSNRRRQLHTNAGGSALEECAVCYLQIILGEQLGISREQMFSDMDDWGYSFRLGSTKRWFNHDADDALAWLQQHGIIERNSSHQPTGNLSTLQASNSHHPSAGSSLN